MADEATDLKARIRFPVKCDYKGGISALGRHGKSFWIRNGQLGYGKLSLTHAIPLSSVSSVEVTERTTEGAKARPIMAAGVYGSRRSPAAKPKQFTEINVRTDDGEVGLWVVERHGGDWVRNKLARPLQAAGIQT
jgi:hypothetical protein